MAEWREEMAEWLVSLLANIPLPIKVIILSAVPVVELRGAIPMGIVMGMSPINSFILSFAGNILPVIPLLIIMPWLFKFFERVPAFRQRWGQLIERTRKKGHQVEKYGALGLLIFVAIPLPGTGVWTGSILAYIMGVNFWYSFIALTSGAFLAGIAVTLATVGVVQAYKYLFSLEVLAGIGLVLIVIWWLIKRRRRRH